MIGLNVISEDNTDEASILDHRYIVVHSHSIS